MSLDSLVPLAALPLFFVVAWLYSSVGHGGASGYLALFAIFGAAGPDLVPIALLLNILVASMSFALFRNHGHFNLRVLVPFVLTSIPAAFVTGLLDFGRESFAILLGLALLSSAWRLLATGGSRKSCITPETGRLWMLGLPAGVILGALSGIIGIGGGVFLSPLLLFLRWTDVRQTAAISSAFIVLNSLSGLVGHLSRQPVAALDVLPLALIVGAGGLLGSQAGAGRLQPGSIRAILAVVLIMAGGKLIGAAL